MMKENLLKLFVDNTTHYFRHLSRESVEVQVPYLIAHHEPVILDYTGIIGVSGAYKGYVYLTAPSKMMRFLLQTQGEQDYSEPHCLDIIGEIANVLAGNVRRELGAEFMISVPLRIAGQPDKLLLTDKSWSFAIPIRYSLFIAALVVSLEECA